jgi:uncharacterized protein YecE (DUF72 family)
MIRIGIGGWKFAPWRKTFYPKGLTQSRELEYASRALTTLEVNNTFYRTPSVKIIREWYSQTPDNFVFSIKASSYATNRRVLAEAGPSITRFLESGITELKTKLGPILWQFAHTKKFDEVDIGAFLKLLPRSQDGIKLRHAIEVRHDSFCSASFVQLARDHGAAIVFADSDKYPSIIDVTADFVYARLMRAKASVKTGYAPAEIKKWQSYAKTWESGGAPEKGLSAPAPKVHRDVFIYMINGAKERAPAAALDLKEKVS